jgi:endoglucanase
MQRRHFLQTVGLGAATTMLGEVPLFAASETAKLAKNPPCWRGFNLLEMFMLHDRRPFEESDFQLISEWGFDFVRLPMDYRCWTSSEDPYKLDEKYLAYIDRAVEYGKKYGVHVCVGLHRAPGYTVAQPAEKLVLWKDEEAQKQFDFQWAMFAKRYRGIPSRQVSFNLVNEPAKVPAEAYARVVRRVVGAIRREDADRLVVADGLEWGRQPVSELADLGIIQSTRGYDPMAISHYKAPWIWGGGEQWPTPTWPLKENGKVIDRASLYEQEIKPWKTLEAKGVGVHVGEWGAFNKTPHKVVLDWARDRLSLWKDAGWGWAMWNFRGSIGVLDSGRQDVAYEDFRGHKVDRKMLDLLQAS